MKGGWSLDRTTVNDAGERWDFNDPRKRAQAKKLVQDRKPRMLIGSPMCTAFSALQTLNRGAYSQGSGMNGFARRSSTLTSAVNSTKFK